MAQANYVTPVLNQPMDPFLQEQIEEQRRYKEAQDARRREENMQDFMIQQRLRDQSAQKRLEMELDARSKAAKRDTRMRRKFQKQDLEDQRNYAAMQSEQMAGELPMLREKIQQQQMRLMKMENNLLISTPQGKQLDKAAYDRTVGFNERFLTSMQGAGITVQPPGGTRGQVMQSTSGFMNWLLNAVPADQAQSIASQYTRAVETEKQAARAMQSDKFMAVQGTLRQLQQREAQILKAVQGGGIDYSAYDAGIMSGPTVPAFDPNASTGNQGIVDFFDSEEGPQSITSGTGVGMYDQAVTDFGVGSGTALEGIEEMNDVFGKYSTDSSVNEAFQNALDTADQFEDPNEAMGYLQMLRERLEESKSAQQKALGERMQDAQDQGFYDAFIQFGTSGGDYGPQMRNLMDASTPDDVRAMERGQMNAYGQADAFILQKMQEVQNRMNQQPATVQGRGQSGNALYMGGNPTAPIQ